MQRVFWIEGVWNKVKTGEFRRIPGKIKDRQNPGPNSPTLEDAPHKEEFTIVDAADEQVAICQWFLKADKNTVAASGFADPKQLDLGGISYHPTGRRNPACAHCEAGIPTTHDVKRVA